MMLTNLAAYTDIRTSGFLACQLRVSRSQRWKANRRGMYAAVCTHVRLRQSLMVVPGDDRV